MLISHAQQLERHRWTRRPARARGVWMADPGGFAVVDVRNVHMEGQEGAVDPIRARSEWNSLADAFRSLGLAVEVLPSVPSLVDLVFTANPTLSGVDREGRPFVIASRMRHENRELEVPHHERFFEERGVPVHRLPPSVAGGFEGGGDGLWHPDTFALWAGLGPRSDAAALAWIAETWQLPIATLELRDPAFYHLDTCFMPLDERRAAIVPDAFTRDGLELLGAGFEELIPVDDREARERLAGNLACPDRHHVLLPAGSPRTRANLEAAGFLVIEVGLDEFKKSGGSVFCLCQELY